MVYGLDPGSEQSAIVFYDEHEQRIEGHATMPNDALLRLIEERTALTTQRALVIEQVESYGMAVGSEVFRTVFWSGRFYQAWKGERYQLPRRDVKVHLCHSARATDANVRQAILDRFAPTKAEAIGKKSKPGPLWGVKGHEFAALAVALTWADLHAAEGTDATRQVTCGMVLGRSVD